jgi:hypothetical protein
MAISQNDSHRPPYTCTCLHAWIRSCRPSFALIWEITHDCEPVTLCVISFLQYKATNCTTERAITCSERRAFHILHALPGILLNAEIYGPRLSQANTCQQSVIPDTPSRSWRPVRPFSSDIRRVGRAGCYRTEQQTEPCDR